MLDTQDTSTIVVSGLLILSEILSLVPIKTNGVLQTIILGLKKGFALNSSGSTSNAQSEPLTSVVTQTEQNVSTQLSECYTQNKDLFDKIVGTLTSGDQTLIDELKKKLEI